jgi:hypothetical protein
MTEPPAAVSIAVTSIEMRDGKGVVCVCIKHLYGEPIRLVLPVLNLNDKTWEIRKEAGNTIKTFLKTLIAMIENENDDLKF